MTITHQQSKTSTYRSWLGMKSRCNNPNFPKYENYGARGIKICKRWNDSYENFIADMGPRPPGVTLHRLDNDGDYEPGNCIWGTTSQQARNKTNTHYLTFKRKTQSLADWANEVGLSAFTLRNRIDVYGWSVKDALTKPVQEPHFKARPPTGSRNHKSVMIKHKGRTQNFAAWAREAGMSEHNLRFRLKSMSMAEALAKPVRSGVGGKR